MNKCSFFILIYIPIHALEFEPCRSLDRTKTIYYDAEEEPESELTKKTIPKPPTNSNNDSVSTSCPDATTHKQNQQIRDLHHAVRVNDKREVYRLVKEGINPTAYYPTKLHYNVPNPPTTVGTTPLHIAARSGFYDMAHFLLLKGANPNACDSYAETPLHAACENINDHTLDHQLNIIRLLIAHKATPTLANNSCKTALHLIRSCKHQKTVSTIFELSSLIDFES